MSRPSKSDSSTLKRLELTSMDLADIKFSLDILELRLRQIGHRIAGCNELVLGALDEVERMKVRSGLVHDAIKDALDVAQIERTKKAMANGG